MFDKFRINKKTSLLIIVVVVAIILVVSFTFLGVFLYQRYTPNVRYVKAEKSWTKASNKKAYDQITIDLALGSEDNALEAKLILDGSRTYKGSVYEFSYDASVQVLGLNVIVLKLDLTGDGENNSIFIEKKDGLKSINFDTINVDIEQEDIEDFEMGKNSLSFYNTKEMKVNKQQEFFIEGDDSVALLINSASLIIKQLINIDIKDILSGGGSNIGKVRGELGYEGAFKLTDISSVQNLTFFMPWQEADALIDSIEEIPENIREIYQKRKITIENIPIIKTITIDFLNYMPDGILANIRIEVKTTYEY